MNHVIGFPKTFPQYPHRIDHGINSMQNFGPCVHASHVLHPDLAHPGVTARITAAADNYLVSASFQGADYMPADETPATQYQYVHIVIYRIYSLDRMLCLI